MPNLHGKTAIITGGATGIGLGIARAFSAKGVRLAIIQPDRTQFQKAATALEGADATAYVADISNRDAVFAIVDQIVEKYVNIDILVNNAGLTGQAALHSFLDTTPDQIDAIINTNLKGTFHMSQAVARHMAAKSIAGSIIHIASVGAYAGQQHASLYCATKAALVSLAQTMALELAPHGIRVNAVAPGDILTTTSADAFTDLKQSGGSGQYVRLTPLGRRGTPREVAGTVVFLASDEASFITGSTITVDGGFLAY